MTPNDLELMLAQSRLVAVAEALSRGTYADALNRYSVFEMSIKDLAQYFSLRP